MKPKDLDGLLHALSQFHRVFAWATTSSDGEAKIDGVPVLVARSEVTQAVCTAADQLERVLKDQYELKLQPPDDSNQDLDTKKRRGADAAQRFDSHVVSLLEVDTPEGLVQAALQHLVLALGYPTGLRNSFPNRKSAPRPPRWKVGTALPPASVLRLSSASSLLRSAEIALLDRPPEDSRTRVPVAELGDLPYWAAHRFSCIEAIDRLLEERYAPAWDFWKQHPRPESAPAPSEKLDLASKVVGDDPTGRTSMWSIGDDSNTFDNALRARGCYEVVAEYRKWRTGSRDQVPIPENSCVTRETLMYLNRPDQIHQLWIELLECSPSLRADVTRRVRDEEAAVESKVKRAQTLEAIARFTPGERKVWDALEGTCGTAPQLCVPLKTTEDTVRAHVRSILRKYPGAIENKDGYGYFRLDAQPIWEDIQPSFERRKIRP